MRPLVVRGNFSFDLIRKELVLWVISLYVIVIDDGSVNSLHTR